MIDEHQRVDERRTGDLMHCREGGGPARGEPAALARRFVALRRHGVRWRVDPGVLGLLLDPPERGGRQLPPAEWSDAGRGALLSSKGERKVYRIDLPDVSVCVKHYAARGWWRGLAERLFAGKARREWRKLEAIRRRGFRTAMPLGLGAASELRGEGYLITKTLGGARSLRELLRFEWGGRPWSAVRGRESAAEADGCRRQRTDNLAEGPCIADPALRARLARKLGAWVARLHSAGIEHRDLHPGNILLDGGCFRGLCASKAGAEPGDGSSKPAASMRERAAERFAERLDAPPPRPSPARGEGVLALPARGEEGIASPTRGEGVVASRTSEVGACAAFTPEEGVLAGPASEPILIDYQAARIGRRLAWRRSRRNLALFDRSFARRVSAWERLRFLHAYLKQRRREGLGMPRDGGRFRAAGASYFRRAVLELQRASWRSCLRFWRRRDRRCVRDGKYFRVVRARRGWSVAVGDLDRDVHDAIARDPDALFEGADAVVLKRDTRSTVARVGLGDGLSADGGLGRDGEAGFTGVWKRYRSRRWTRRLLDVFRRGRGWNAWRMGHALVARGIATPRPLMLVVKRRGLLRDTYLMTEAVANAVNLADYATSRRPVRSIDKRLLIEQLAAMIGWSHRCGFDHRDLKGANVLVQPAAARRESSDPPEAFSASGCGLPDVRLYLIDLDGVRLRRRLAPARRVQNLSRLHASFHDNRAVSRTDKLRFLRRYLAELADERGRTRRKDAAWKSLWRAIERRTRRKLAQNERRGRMMT